jgi:hypothetical protein
MIYKIEWCKISIFPAPIFYIKTKKSNCKITLFILTNFTNYGIYKLKFT